MGVERVGRDDNFFELGGHSFAAIGLMARIRKLFGQQLPLSILFRAGTVASLAEILHQSPKQVASSPLVAIQPLGARPPFFCVHPGGGIVYSYVALARCLGLEQPFYALEAVGIAQDAQPYIRIEDMAAHYIGAMQTIQSAGPYLIGGWSFGGVVAFEMAQQLNARGHKVALLALFDAELDFEGELKMEADDAELLAEMFREFIPGLPQMLCSIESSERLQLALRLVKESNLLPPDFEFEEVRRLARVARANTEALIQYRPKTYAGRVTIFRAEDTFEKLGVLAP